MIDVNTPVILPMGTGLTGRMGDDEKQVLEEMEDAIAVATTNLGLVPGVAFQARVMQLAQLSTAHKTVGIYILHTTISAIPRCLNHTAKRTLFLSK